MKTLLQTPCKEWIGAKSSGYGQKWSNGKVRLVHRIAWEESKGTIPEGMVVRHKCDNSVCYEITHLELGTHKENTQDMMKRGRHIAGNTILTQSQVDDIRARYKSFANITQIKLAREYGVHQTTISHIILNKSWNDDEEEEV